MPKPIQLTFKSEKELAAFIERVTRPIAEQIAARAVDEKMAFRKKKVTANPQSIIETTSRTGSSGGTVGFYGSVGNTKLTLTGSKSNGGGSIAALNNLITILSDAPGGLGLITNSTT